MFLSCLQSALLKVAGANEAGASVGGLLVKGIGALVVGRLLEELAC